MKIIATKEPKNLVYIDESGIDNTEDYPYGYCQKGQRFYALKSGKKTQRISMVAALSGRKIVVPLTFEGHCNMDVFNGWFEQFLTPILEPGQTVILDNATFHKSDKIIELAKGVGAEILSLLPYSPDFNKIEHHWFAIKNRARKNIPLFESFRRAVDSAFLCPVRTIMRNAIIAKIAGMPFNLPSKIKITPDVQVIMNPARKFFHS